MQLLLIGLAGVALAQATVNSGTSGQTGCYAATGTTISGCNNAINAAVQAGATLVDQINKALALGNDVFIPAGAYNVSGCSGWTSDAQSGDPWSPFYVGVKLPTGSHVHGAGKGLTVINVTRLPTDPRCALFANAKRSGLGNNPNIELDHMTINWKDQTTNDTGAIEIAGADRFSMHDVEISGNPNRQLIITDVTRISIHDNTFLVNTTSGVQGNTAISSNRFQSGMPYTMDAGEIYGNKLIETGDPTLGVSMVVLTQSNLTFGPDNTCDLLHYTSVANPNAYGGNCIESGNDNPGNIAGYFLVQGNYFWGGVRLPIVNTEFSGNFFYQGYGLLAGYAGSVPTAARLKVQNNTFHCSGAGANCGIFVEGNSPQGMPFVTVSDNTVEDGVLIVSAGGSGETGAPNCIVENNRVLNAPITGSFGALEANGCSVVRGNLVKNPQADSFNGFAAEYGIYLGSSSPSLTTTFDDVSGNRVIDDQIRASGTGCSVASPSSTTCLTSGTSLYFYSSGAAWTPAISNRYIFVGKTAYMVRNFYSSHYLEFEHATAYLPSGTSWSMTSTMGYGYYLGANIVNFSDNFGYVAHQHVQGYPGGGWITDISGNKIISLRNNHFISARQAVCSNTASCNYNYYNQTHNPVGGASCANTAGSGMVVCPSSLTTLYTMPNIATSQVGGVLFSYLANIDCASANTGATAILTLSYRDVSGTTQTVTAGTATCTTLGAASTSSLSGTLMMYGNSAVSYEVTTANSPNYQARVVIFQETTN
jgi:hypothetical protein